MNRIDKCEDVYEKLFGGKPADLKTGNDPEMMMILQRFIFGEVFDIGKLKEADRELITVACLATLQAIPQLKAHTQAALNVGNTPLTIREVIYQCAPFIGFPRTLNAIEAMNEVFEKNDISLPLELGGTVKEEERYVKGLEIQAPIYGNEIKDKYAELPDGMGEALPRFLTELCFGDFYTRKGLDKKQRELLMLCVLATLRADTQILPHAIGNLKVGNSKATMYGAMIQCLPYIGFPAVFEAINIIKDVEEV